MVGQLETVCSYNTVAAHTHVSNHHTLPHRSSIVGLLATLSSSIEAHCSRMRSTNGPTVALSFSPSSGQGTWLSRRKVLVKSAPRNTLYYSTMPRLQKHYQEKSSWHFQLCLITICTSVVHEAQQVWYELAVLCLFFSHKAQFFSHDTQVEGFICWHEFIQDSPCLSCIQLRAQCLCQTSQVPATHRWLGLIGVAPSLVRGVANEIWIKSETRVEKFSYIISYE